MPLSTGTTKNAREANISREIAAGKDPKQAVAIGYAKQRENIASKSKDSITNNKKEKALQALTKDIAADMKLLVKLLNQ